MSKFCPEVNDVVLYTDCLECETKLCNVIKVAKSRPVKQKISHLAPEYTKPEPMAHNNSAR